MKNKLNFIQRIKILFTGKIPVNTDVLDTQDFYEVMHDYRHSPMTDQHKVVHAFENVKRWIRNNIN